MFKVHSIGIEPSNCTITVNGVVTQSLMSDMVAVQVNTGDVVKVITTTTTADYYVRIIGFVLEGNCGVSVFVNDAGYLTEHQDISGKQDVLISGTNIKTINNNSIVGSGNLDVGTIKGVTINNTTKTPTNGTVDLGTVLTTTTSSVTQSSKIPITSGGVFSALENYETKLSFTTSSSTSYTAQKNEYCRFTNTLSSLGISLPTSYLTVGDTCAFNFTTSESFSSFTISGGTIKKMKDFAIKANGTYEVVALYDGVKWLVTVTEFE